MIFGVQCVIMTKDNENESFIGGLDMKKPNKKLLVGVLLTVALIVVARGLRLMVNDKKIISDLEKHAEQI